MHTTMPMSPEVAESIESISGSLVIQLGNLEGLCSLLRPLGRIEGKETINPAAFAGTLGVIADGIKSVSAGVEHIGSLSVPSSLGADVCTTLSEGR